MNLLQLSYFISVAKYRNFTSAARDFFVSQPCISHQIRELEQELGVRLFVRNTRSVELTAQGEIFLEDAKKVVDILERSKNKLLQSSDASMSLNIAHLASPSRIFLPSVVKHFHQKYPQVRVSMDRCNALQIYQAASKHQYDIYISMALDLTAYDFLAWKNIQADHYCLVTPRDHPAITRLPMDYSKLASEPFIVFNPEYAVVMHRQILQICSCLGFSPRITGIYNLYEDLLYAVEAGLGITILPYRTKNYLNNDLAYTLLDVSNVSADLAMAWEQKVTNPAVPLFLEVFLSYMQEHPELF